MQQNSAQDKNKGDVPGLPAVDCVVIGVNASATLGRCLESIRATDYPRDLLTVFYVDGGSSDRSLEIAGALPGVRVIALHPEYPTPGLGRNRGWQAGKAPFVQFLDSDTILDPAWLQRAVAAMADDVAAVMGYRREMHTEVSVFNWIGSLEWNGRPGEAESFGGDVLVRRAVLVATGGYDEELVGGEDPELSRRICLSGWRILQLDLAMTSHDLAMTTVGQYWRRAYRSGYAFAAVIDRFAGNSTSFWQKEFRRIIVRGGGFIGCSMLALLLAMLAPEWSMAAVSAPVSLLVGILLLLFPRLFRIGYFQDDKKITSEQARIYAWHCSLVVVPDIFGVLRYYIGKLLDRPLRNKRNKLATAAMHGDER
jgi:cellulose synthase/poly-beta-1,6-N-acetylglucosamine synthase-like glycosyltransferase